MVNINYYYQTRVTVDTLDFTIQAAKNHPLGYLVLDVPSQLLPLQCTYTFLLTTAKSSLSYIQASLIAQRQSDRVPDAIPRFSQRIREVNRRFDSSRGWPKEWDAQSSATDSSGFQRLRIMATVRNEVRDDPLRVGTKAV